MDKLYIPGDLVKYLSQVVKTVEVYQDGTCYFGNETMCGQQDCKDAEPIPLTPEILEKNGWKREVMSRGVKNSHWVYTKPDIEEYGYFPIYIEKGIGDEFDVYPFTDNNVCKQMAYIKYVHELQHLLFGLGINHKMEV